MTSAVPVIQRRVVGGEIDEAVGDVARRADAPERGAAQPLWPAAPAGSGCSARKPSNIGVSTKPGQMQFARMPRLRPVQRHAAREHDQPRLGGDIRCVLRCRDDAGDRGRVQDHAAARLGEVRPERLRDPIGAAQIDVDLPLPVRVRELGDAAQDGDAGIVHQHLDRSARRQRLLDQAGHIAARW